MIFQRAVGVWASSPARRLLWAFEQVLLKARVTPEQTSIDAWAKTIADLFVLPVIQYDWESYYTAMQKTDHDPPPAAVAGWDAVATKIIDELWPQAGSIRADTMGLPFDEAHFATALASTQDQVKGVDEVMKDRLRALMKDAYDRETTQFGFARSIRAEFPEIARQRSDLIAVTEWNRGASAATYEGMVAQGVERKAWFTAGDDRVCDLCEANSAMGEIPLNDEFFTGDLYPPAHPGCRCNVSSG